MSSNFTGPGPFSRLFSKEMRAAAASKLRRLLAGDVALSSPWTFAGILLLFVASCALTAVPLVANTDIPPWLLFVMFVVFPANLFISAVLYKPERKLLKVIGICAASIPMIATFLVGFLCLPGLFPPVTGLSNSSPDFRSNMNRLIVFLMFLVLLALLYMTIRIQKNRLARIILIIVLGIPFLGQIGLFVYAKPVTTSLSSSGSAATSGVPGYVQFALRTQSPWNVDEAVIKRVSGRKIRSYGDGSEYWQGTVTYEIGGHQQQSNWGVNAKP